MLLRRTIAALSLLWAVMSPLAAIAQAPPAVPALPDSERRTAYSISGTTCVCAVNFQIYGTGSDVDSWIQVWVNGVRKLSTDSTFGWSLSSVTGSLSTIPRPITDAVLTFNAVQTATVQIVGADRPRQLSQFTENRGVAARDLNQRFTEDRAIARELWDKTSDLSGRGLFFAPGNTTGPMPQPSACSSAILGFDSTGLNPTCLVNAPAGSILVPNSVNTRPVNETSYTVQSSDNFKLIIANSSTAVTLTLPLFSQFKFQAVNIGTGPLFIVPSGGVTINGFQQHELSKLQSATITSDNANYWADDQIAGNSAGWNARQLITFDTVTTGPVLTLSGTVTTGDTVGFNFSATSPSFNIPFRYTYLAGDTLGTAAQALIAAFQANATVIANIGDAAKYANAHQSGANWVLGFDSLYPFSSTSGQTFTAFASGGATSSISPSSASASNTLEATAFLGLGRSARYASREPAAGDGLGGIFVTGDTTGNTIQQNSLQPIYGAIEWSILNPAPGTATALLQVIADTINLRTAGLGGSAGHGVGINISSPDAPLTVVPGGGTTVTGAAAVSGTLVHVIGAYGNNAEIQLDAQSSAGNDTTGLFGRSARGTAGSLSASQSGDLLTFVAGGGYGATGYSGGGGQFRCFAAQNFTDTAQGTFCSIWTTPNGSATTSLAEAVRFNASGGFGVGTATDPGIGAILANTSIKATTTVEATTGYRINGAAGLTQTCTVNQAKTLIFTLGILTGGTCNT